MPYKDLEKRAATAKIASTKYYAKNRDKVIAASAKVSLKFRTEWSAYKATLSCAICGFSHPAAMDFHHPPGTKEHSVNILVQRRNMKMLRVEIAKCIVLCANCHRILHHDEFVTKRRKRKKSAGKGP